MGKCSSMILLFSALIAATPASQGVEFIRASDFVLAEDQKLETDTWILADRVTLAGEADDDLFLCVASRSRPDTGKQSGGEVRLTGILTGDLWAIAGHVSIDSAVHGHARLLADRISIAGRVNETVILLGNTVDMLESSELASGGLIAADTVIAKGAVSGKLDIRARKATLAGEFGGDVHIEAPDIVVLPGTRIKGKLSYLSKRELLPGENVIVEGGLERRTLPQQAERPAFDGLPLLVRCWLLGGALLVGLGFAGMFPAFLDRSSTRIRASFWQCALYGMAAFFAIPILVFFAMLSIVGFIPGLLLLTVFALLVYLSKIAVALTIGSLILRRPWRGSFSRLLLSLFAGLLLLYLATGAGIVGLAAWCIVTFTGMGAMLAALFSRQITVASGGQSQ